MNIIVHLLLLLVILLFRSFRFLKIEHYTIDAITQTGRRWTIFKHMSQVRFTSSAHYFRPFHSVGVIGCINNAAFADWLVKAWPAATTVKFGIAQEERVTANSTIISTDLLKVFKFTGPGTFCTLQAGNTIHICWQYPSPLLVFKVHLRRIGVAVNRVILFLCRIHSYFFWSC